MAEEEIVNVRKGKKRRKKKARRVGNLRGWKQRKGDRECREESKERGRGGGKEKRGKKREGGRLEM